MKVYTTKIKSYTLDTDAEPVLGIEVPEGFITDLDLKENEVLQWEIDEEAQVAYIKKTKIIIND